MKYDDQYYLLLEDQFSSKYMIKKNRKSDEGIRLLRQQSIKREVLGLGYVEITCGDDGQFSPCDYHGVMPSASCQINSRLFWDHIIYVVSIFIQLILRIME
ncbi:hypothetical protein L4174_009110 [Photobacterium sp. CCB-ST2H9]|uniref:hypothetical protein n=1 Tax=Photobacterium sp. CCB-ST2H9 TaxID=2912855 RepID=UPI002006B622|nr:hypothetical protein [Photobacterium sp. CCB-ST2H9]UTM56013.1 hypothetical protein L4174_009110 [Photobacterium sp. CCB-ST2H9]